MIEKNEFWSTYKIKAIAEELGFSSGRNFSDAFIKKWDFRPLITSSKKKKSKAQIFQSERALLF